MELHLTLQGRGDLVRQIHRQLRDAILEGRLAPGERLPPTRELAARLSVARNTVAVAYEWLSAEGLLSGRAGAGSFVEQPPGASRPARVRSAAGAPLVPRPQWRHLEAPLDRGPAPPYDFDAGVPDARLFPYDAWRRHVARQLRASALRGGDADPAGLPRLRAALAHHVALARGVRAAAEDVLVTSGAQGALDLIGRVLLEPGARVAVEEPGYPPARRLFESLGARIAPVPVDAQGLRVDALPEDARLVYVTPSHQFPLGMPLSHARRVALLAWAERRNAVLVEDDYDSEFRFGGRPLESLQGADRTGRVLYVGSLSKVMLPSLRLGFLVAPASLQPALRAASALGVGHCPLPEQAALARFIEDGLLARHVRRMRRAYAARHARILAALQGDFGEWLEPVASETGLHLTAHLRAGGVAREADIVRRALEAGVRVGRLSALCAAKVPAAGLVLGYGAIALPRLDEGLRRLRAACAAAAVSRHPARPARGPRR
ncbi:PLP-dependent aminotransferase family protein [Aggregicoccus sp. 17bor-14]|uniref:MocR-like pyridoxine biosynthesis transcription factor PdxR n=1 Tax=Myxococcaceae TaxID=31 RepID=UPI00129CD1E2|nr:MULTISPECIES: PLP-dependent aminotransferase family protein [Myxococcaceae]MBF5042194.1 PLP-dependent aminotransferase family protein [Simulacricoccus sp. 17bor-14]MRI87970.1 PLP-dependent aminotransferase family protein [Aggregicoccus sp. 17bor-14]